MKQNKPNLYVKSSCPWCHEAISFLSHYNIDVNIKDVQKCAQDMQHMQKISQQSMTPTIEYGELMVADFSIDELLQALKGYPEIQRTWGIKTS